MADRKKELKKWFIDHPGITTVSLGKEYGCSKQAAYRYLFQAQTCPEQFISFCLTQGIPARLLPPSTKPKGQLLAENKRLRRELAWCWSKLEQFGTHPGEAIR